MENPQEMLKQFNPKKPFFVGVDSDGCVFDTMEVKHKECFCPAFIQYMGLQTVSKYAREVWDFVNLYSRTRGLNRFLALIEAVKLLGERPEVAARGIELPPMSALKAWTEKEGKLGEAALAEYIKNHSEPVLQAALDWSRALNARVAEVVYGIKPFPLVKESLEALSSRADILVVSQTPLEALDREWAEHQIDPYIAGIAGQEMGTKAEHLQLAAGGKYASDRVLMIGDAPGDYQSAEKNGFLFFPIVPGKEEESWQRLHEEAMERFFSEEYRGDYQKRLLDEFEAQLPEHPPWSV